MAGTIGLGRMGLADGEVLAVLRGRRSRGLVGVIAPKAGV